MLITPSVEKPVGSMSTRSKDVPFFVVHFVFVFETRSHSVAQAGLELAILLASAS
jgi:hypothetical protein